MTKDNNIHVVHVKETSVCCNGQHQEDNIGHPQIYLEIDKKTLQVTCPYCNCVFKLQSIKK